MDPVLSGGGKLLSVLPRLTAFWMHPAPRSVLDARRRWADDVEPQTGRRDRLSTLRVAIVVDPIRRGGATNLPTDEPLPVVRHRRSWGAHVTHPEPLRPGPRQESVWDY
jgi:hypothetical protein